LDERLFVPLAPNTEPSAPFFLTSVQEKFGDSSIFGNISVRRTVTKAYLNSHKPRFCELICVFSDKTISATLCSASTGVFAGFQAVAMKLVLFLIQFQFSFQPKEMVWHIL
jgi:hypothetical protein